MSAKVNGTAVRRLFSPRTFAGTAASSLIVVLWLSTSAVCLLAQPGDPSPAAQEQATPALQQPQAPARSAVYEIHDASAIEHFTPRTGRVHAMVDRLALAVTGKDSVAAAWRSLVEPKDIVGIKISATGGASGATHHAVVEAIVDGLRAAGVPNANIVIWDREIDDLRAAGYVDAVGQSRFGCPVLGIEPRFGYDPKEVYTAPFLGKLIWGDLNFKGSPVPADLSPRADRYPLLLDPLAAQPSATPTPDDARRQNAAALAAENLSNASHYCTILSRRVTRIINVPVLSDNYFCGIGGALYNVTVPNVDNWRRLVGSPRFGIQAIPELYSDPHLGGKVVFNLTDGLIAQIAGGPYFQPLYAQNHATLYASRDAVALDAVTLRLLETWRAKAKLPALGESASHVHTASDLGLGNDAVEKIDLHPLNP